jgi:hypothetical protein
LALAGVSNGSYFAAVAPENTCRDIEALGALCAPLCGPGSARACHVRHLAMTLALASLKSLYFTSWAETTVDWVLRRGLLPGV